MLLVGCSIPTNQFISHNRFQKTMGRVVYHNDSLRLSAMFYGDYVFHSGNKQREISRKSIEIIKSGYKEGLYLTEKDLIFTAETIVEPKFYSALFSLHNLSKRRLNEISKIAPDFFWSDSVRNVAGIGQIFTDATSAVFLIGFTYDHLTVRNKNSLQQQFFFNQTLNALSREFRDADESIFKSVLSGSNYKLFEAEDPFILANKYYQTEYSGNYLLPINELLESEPNYVSTQDRYKYLQALLTYMSFIDHPQYDYYNKKRKQIQSRSIINYSKRFNLNIDEIQKTILDSSSHQRVVMFNESHYVPSIRSFIMTLLDGLYQQGFRYLALEALEEDRLVNEKKFPVISSGFYFRDFRMANIARMAKKLGYHLIKYDSRETNREEKQAQRLAQLIANSDTNKIVVLSGFSHIDENPDKKRMASILKKISGINPFTINMTDISETRIELNSNICFTNNSTDRIQLPSYFMNNDLYVSICNDDFINDAFTFHKHETLNIHLDFSGIAKRGEYVLLVFDISESPNEGQLPVFAKLVLPKMHEQIDIKLLPGRYNVLLKSEDGLICHDTTLYVEVNK
ncbi:MAG TPA: hypothetical protein PLG25_06570 [bacterium]|nr:hypothetical protein [bacterium]HMZ03346.1 hypothetical protein [bacterium]HND77416.1 hypothetical protein [bacterium]HNE83519.1 hypothetical protein [bacterium]HNH32531.1 hypothetical protein [bacterium]